ncbi:MFS transporter [Puniceibacterium sp. IMCC21224]|uniref:MFS transporter n=1 Tax=Puniceibacterium sp. IMCC21224 TaxID=1618204 RepID=UPI00064D931A|nr:MFS transporter [Puniceibacterium sp. IMCC21224]KMK66492.1 arabinose efflux permease family protein [Puniceibacterium sp. IMCC21224]
MPRATFFVILALWGAGLGAAGQFAKISVAFPALALIYPQAGASLGFAVSLLSLVGLLLGVVAGMIVARLGYRRMLLSGLMLGAALSMLQALLPPLPVFLLSRLAEGLSHLVIVVAAPTLIAELAPDRWRAGAMTLWSSFFGVAYGLAAWLGLPLIDQFGPGALLAVHGGYMALMALLLWSVLPVRSLATPQPLPGWRDILRQHGTIYQSPRIGAAGLGWLCYTLTFVSLLTVLPMVLGPQAPPWLTGVLPLTSIAVSLVLVAPLLRVVPAVPVVIAGFALSALGTLLVWSLPGALWPPILLFGALALVQAASFAAIPQLNDTPSARALANGAVAQMGNMGNLAGTPVLLAALALAGPGGGLAFIFLSYACGLALHVWLARRRRV